MEIYQTYQSDYLHLFYKCSQNIYSAKHWIVRLTYKTVASFKKIINTNIAHKKKYIIFETSDQMDIVLTMVLRISL